MSSDSGNEHSEEEGTGVNLRLGECEVCAVNVAKYTCPKCELKTCSLPCINIHKKELSCDGIRDQTKFVRLASFTDRDLHSDYRMLEETARMIYGKKRDEGKRFTRIERDLPFMMHMMKKAASRRGIVLMFTLHHFTRRRQNTTYYDLKKDKLDWRVEWVFPNADPHKTSELIREDYPVPEPSLSLLPAATGSNENLHQVSGTKFIDERCPEDTKLADLLDKYLDPNSEKFEGSNSLIYYQSAGHIGVKILLKAERVKGCSRKFYELDMDLSLKENLCGKCIIEFPVILVIPKTHCDGLDIIDSDDETAPDLIDNADPPSEGQRNTRLPRQLLTERVAIVKKKAIEEEIAAKIKKQPKNLLFTTGYSSEEGQSSDSDNAVLCKKIKS